MKLLILLLAAMILPASAARKGPNFIFMFTDDQRWDAMGVVQREQGEKARFPWLETPAMDRLAAEGVRFRNAFVTLSLCTPSRAAFLTGQHNHTNGVINNGRRLAPDAVTHASLLRAAGYKTGYFGKWHMGEERGQRPGFDYSASYIGQGRYQDCPFEINGVPSPTQGWVDDVSTDFAIRWIEEQAGRPFSLVLGFKSPHNMRGGVNLPPRLRTLYEGRTTRPTPNCGVPTPWQRSETPGDQQPAGITELSAHLDYLRHVKGVDENVGRLLDALDRLGLAEDTVVVYSSDNGFFLGEHCSGDKRALYEESLRVPMLVRYPRLFGKGRVVDEMVLNIDLAPTFLELAGLDPHPAMQGMSWKALAEGAQAVPWRDGFLMQYYKELGNVPTCYGIRTRTHKLVVYPNVPEWDQLFDLEKDPYEIRNLAGDAALRADLQKRLDVLVKETGYTVPADANKGRKAAVKAVEGAAVPRETRDISGWQVHIHKALLEKEAEDTARALAGLKKMLDEIVRDLPAPAVAELRKVPLYFSPAYGPDGSHAEYHPGAQWLKDNGRDPAMARCIEFSGVSDFEAEMRRMPNFALHELAHAYHDRFLPGGYANAELEAAYQRAKASGTYEKVERSSGDGRPNRIDRAYAMTNAMEYFAESTEAYFSRNDFFPFNRDQLRSHDPAMLALVEKLWGVPAAP